MFQNITQTYTLQDASIEIALMLIGAFVLGFIFAWVAKPRSIIYESIAPSSSYTAAKRAEMQRPEKDDLQLIDGISSKLESHLNKNGITRFDDIVSAGVDGLAEILKKSPKALKKISPLTWPDQAKLASEGKWSELEEYQQILATSQKGKNKL